MYEVYLKGIGKLEEAIVLGSPGDQKGLKSSDEIDRQSRILTESLDKRFKFNNNIIILAILLLCILFAIGVFLVFFYRNSPSVMGGVFGGTFLALLSIIKWLHKLWKEKSLMDISLCILEGLPPEKAAESISTLYWKLHGTSGNNQ
jgi:uncharacterized protein YqhQ